MEYARAWQKCAWVTTPQPHLSLELEPPAGHDVHDLPELAEHAARGLLVCVCVCVRARARIFTGFREGRETRRRRYSSTRHTVEVVAGCKRPPKQGAQHSVNKFNHSPTRAWIRRDTHIGRARVGRRTARNNGRKLQARARKSKGGKRGEGEKELVSSVAVSACSSKSRLVWCLHRQTFPSDPERKESISPDGQPHKVRGLKKAWCLMPTQQNSCFWFACLLCTRTRTRKKTAGVKCRNTRMA